MPMGSCLTLTLVLFASLTPQPAGAGTPETTQRSPQSAVLRSTAGGEIAIGYALLLDAGPGAIIAPLSGFDHADATGAAVPGSPAALPANPTYAAHRTRAP